MDDYQSFCGLVCPMDASQEATLAAETKASALKRLPKAIGVLRAYTESHDFKIILLDATSGDDPILSNGKKGGYVDLANREIVVRTMDERGEALSPEELCLFWAHEVRHLMHVQAGLYASYYNLDYDHRRLAKGGLRVENDQDIALIPNLLVGLKAERDCDSWAEAFVRENINPSFTNSYPYAIEDVIGYNDYCAALSDRRRGIRVHLAPLEQRHQNLVEHQALMRLSQTKAIESPARGDGKAAAVTSDEADEANATDKGSATVYHRWEAFLSHEVRELRADYLRLAARCGRKSLVHSHCIRRLLDLMSLLKTSGLAVDLR